MAKKLLNTLTNNIGYKILALLLAGILWMVVYNLDDPTITKTFTTNVTVTNADAVEDLNKVYEMQGNTVTFRVSGARSYLEKLEDANFSAVADMNNLVMSDDQETATVPITITSNLYSRYITYTGGTQYLTVSLEDLMSRQFSISVSTDGEAADGYAIGDVTVSNPNVLKVSGPASVVSTISNVKVVIDVEGMSSNVIDNIVPILYDADGNEIDTTRLTFSSDTVSVTAEIVPTKTVSVSFTPDGTPESGYSVTAVACTPDTVTIKGSSSLLNSISVIEIPGEVLSVDGEDADVSTTVDISEYLPDGVELLDEDERTVTITITIEGMVSRQVTIPADNIEITGISSGMEAALGQTSVVVTITGMANAINDLTGDDLTGTVDVSGLEAGTHSVSCVVTPSDDYTASDKKVTVVLTDLTAADEESTSETGEGTSGSSGQNSSEEDTSSQEESDTSDSSDVS